MMITYVVNERGNDKPLVERKISCVSEPRTATVCILMHDANHLTHFDCSNIVISQIPMCVCIRVCVCEGLLWCVSAGRCFSVTQNTSGS